MSKVTQGSQDRLLGSAFPHPIPTLLSLPDSKPLITPLGQSHHLLYSMAPPEARIP